MNDDNQGHHDQGCDDESPIEKKKEDAKREGKSKQEKETARSLPQQIRDLGIDRRIELGVALVGLIVAVVLAYTAINQLSAMKDQTTSMQGQLTEMKIAGEATRLEQRAWVGVKHLRLLDELKAGRVIIAQADYTNTGHTPALDTNAHIGTHMSHISEEPVDIGNISQARMKPTRQKKPFVVFPNQLFSSGPVRFDFTPTKLDIENIMTSKMLLYVFGELSYTDVFHRTHITEFCGQFSPASGTLNTCDQHNHAD